LEVVEVPSRFEITDELWAEIEPLIPARERRRRYPGRKAIDDRLALNGILHVLHTGIAWEDLPREYGYGSGVTCWRRLRTWQKAGVWEALHQKLLVKLNAAGKIDWSRASVDASHIRALLGGS
jgi:transposase